MVADQHRTGDELDCRHIGADGSHQLRRHGLVAAANQHDGIDGCARIISSVSMAIRFRRNIEVGLAKDSWMEIVGNSIGRPPGQHHAALHRLDESRHIAVAGVEVAEGVVMPMIGRSSASSENPAP